MSMHLGGEPSPAGPRVPLRCDHEQRADPHSRPAPWWRLRRRWRWRGPCGWAWRPGAGGGLSVSAAGAWEDAAVSDAPHVLHALPAALRRAPGLGAHLRAGLGGMVAAVRRPARPRLPGGGRPAVLGLAEHGALLLRELHRGAGLPVLKHVLTPRIKATYVVFDSMKNYLDAIYDVTVVYGGKDNKGQREEPPSMTEFLCKGCPTIHIHIGRIDEKDVPEEQEYMAS